MTRPGILYCGMQDFLFLFNIYIAKPHFDENESAL